MDIRIEQAMQNNYGRLTKGQRMIGEFILSNLEKTAFMTSFELAAACGASQPSVIRFASALGYDGFGAMQDNLRLELKRRFSPAEQFNMLNDFQSSADAVDSIGAWDSANIRKTMSGNAPKLIEKVCGCMKSAHKLYIYGANVYAVAAIYLASCLRISHSNVCCINQIGENPIDIIRNIGDNDILVVISMPVHGQSAEELCVYAKNNGAHVVVIADFEQSCLANIADDKLCCVCGELGINGTMAPLVSLCGTIGCFMLK